MGNGSAQMRSKWVSTQKKMTLDQDTQLGPISKSSNKGKGFGGGETKN